MRGIISKSEKIEKGSRLFFYGRLVMLGARFLWTKAKASSRKAGGICEPRFAQMKLEPIRLCGACYE
jgi:hypothetical protein